MVAIAPKGVLTRATTEEVSLTEPMVTGVGRAIARQFRADYDSKQPPLPRSAKAVTRVALTPGAETLSDKTLEKLAALPRKQRRAKLAELKRDYQKAVRRARKAAAGR